MQLHQTWLKNVLFFRKNITVRLIFLVTLLFLFPVTAHAVTESFESGDFSSLPWQTGGDGVWSVTNTKAFDGSFAAEAPVSIGDNQSSYLELTANYYRRHSVFCLFGEFGVVL